MDPVTGGLIAKIGGSLLGGLFGRSSAKRNHRYAVQDAIESLPRLRQSAEKAGFNPLSALMSGAAGGFNVGGLNSPPLISTEAAMGLSQSISDIVTGKEARDNAIQDAQLEMAQIQLDQMKAGDAGPIVQSTTRRTTGSPVTLRTPSLSPGTGPGAFSFPSIAPGRETEVMPAVNSPGVFQLENQLTGPGGVTLPGDQEPWGFDELLTAVTVGGPQVMWNLGKRMANNGVMETLAPILPKSEPAENPDTWFSIGTPNHGTLFSIERAKPAPNVQDVTPIPLTRGIPLDMGTPSDNSDQIRDYIAN